MLKVFVSALAALALVPAVSGQAPVEPDVMAVNYTHEGDELRGYYASPNGTGPHPIVVIVPDWDGVNEYEQIRATMIAMDWNYTAFAADIYGADLQEVTDSDMRVNLSSTYRNDPDLFTGRIQAAVEQARMLPDVDTENVAIIGYCFGGTGVLTYAMTSTEDQEEGIQAIVSFHGGLGGVPNETEKSSVGPSVMVLSGGSDDAATDIMDLEEALDDAGATWEVTRYAGIEHAFTVFGDDRYNELVDERSWETTLHYLQEAFGEISFDASPPESISVTPVNYTDGDTELRGYLAIPDPDQYPPPYPGIAIMPDWDGVNEYEQMRATMLADLGYVAFATDIYGADNQTDLDMDEKVELVDRFFSNIDSYVRRMQLGIDQVSMAMDEENNTIVDMDKIGIIGYCFGGSGVTEYALSGASDAKVAVAFHGSFTRLSQPEGDITPYIAILSGGDDDGSFGNQTLTESTLEGATWEITRYSGVGHAFTVWEGDAYDANADARSWEAMLNIFDDQLMASDDSMGEIDNDTSGDTNNDEDSDPDGGNDGDSDASSAFTCRKAAAIVAVAIFAMI